jgi:hypothetical protein
MQSRGMYAVILQIPQDEYFSVYDSINDNAATEIVKNYLYYRGDDGRPEKVKITHNHNDKIVNINLYLYYTGNDHTEIFRTPDILNITKDGNI